MERRERSFPITFAITKPTRSSPGTCEMYYAHEWEALQKSLQPAQAPDGPEQANAQPPDEPAQASAESAHVNDQSAAPAAEPTGDLANAAAKPRTEWCRANPPDFARHTRTCSVCCHPDRDAIEGDFIRWRSPELIARDYKIPNRSSIYRHAHSTGLFTWRKQELGRVLEGILESAEHVPLVSSDVIIRAARIYSHLDEHGNWFEPPRTNFIFTGPAPRICSPEIFEQSKSRRAKKQKAGKSNRNSRQIKKSVKSIKPKEKANF